jgi:[ribosomal protein S5]-alanine N-acetyltransferase
MSPGKFAAPVSIQTPRVLLRRLTLDDAKDIFETWAQDPEVTRYLTWHPHRSLEDTRSFLAYCARAWTEGREFSWGIVPRVEGVLVGTIGLRIDAHRGEFGYALARPAWGQGYATEAARAVVESALAMPAIQRVWAFVDVENVPSARVLEKAGLTREGCLRKWYVPSGFGVPRDAWCYANIQEQP